jgi:hypothetical protein
VTIVLNVGGRAWKMQVEMHPLWQQAKLRAYCKEKGILLSAYSPLGAAGNAHGTNDVITNPTIGKIAVKYGKTPAQVRLFPNLPKLEDALVKMNSICTPHKQCMNTVYTLSKFLRCIPVPTFLVRKHVDTCAGDIAMGSGERRELYCSKLQQRSAAGKFWIPRLETCRC